MVFPSLSLLLHHKPKQFWIRLAFFVLPCLLCFLPFWVPWNWNKTKRMIPQNLGPNMLAKFGSEKLWGGSLWLIYHDTTGWWVPLSKGLSFSILWEMHSWLGMSTISTQQISEMKPTISFKICCYFPMDHLCSLRNPASPVSAPGPLICQSRATCWFGRVWVLVH